MENKADKSETDTSKADESKVTLTTGVRCNNGTFVGEDCLSIGKLTLELTT